MYLISPSKKTNFSLKYKQFVIIMKEKMEINANQCLSKPSVYFFVLISTHFTIDFFIIGFFVKNVIR